MHVDIANFVLAEDTLMWFTCGHGKELINFQILG